MSSRRAIGRAALMAAASAGVWAGILAGAQTGHAAPGDNDNDPAPTTGVVAPPPAMGANPSFAPTNPVDCTDPNNAVNCQTPPIDSPLVVGTAAPGSPMRD